MRGGVCATIKKTKPNQRRDDFSNDSPWFVSVPRRRKPLNWNYVITFNVTFFLVHRNFPSPLSFSTTILLFIPINNSYTTLQFLHIAVPCILQETATNSKLELTNNRREIHIIQRLSEVCSNIVSNICSWNLPNCKRSKPPV